MSKVGSGNKAITVILSLETYEVLKSWAEIKDWSISQAARNLVESGLVREHNTHPQAATRSKKEA